MLPGVLWRLIWMPPPATDTVSGKAEIPCERMHSDILSACARAAACSAGVGWPPLGNRCRQSFMAAWNVDDPGSSPVA